MKIIIIGNGKLGKYLANMLVNEKHNVSILDKNESVLEKISNTLDVSTFCGNALVIENLLDANVENADIVISTMQNDEDNILSSLLSKKLGAKNTIARVRNPEYINTINFFKNELGISMIINPEALTAKEISSTLKFSNNIKTSFLAKGKVELLEFKLKSDSPLINVKLKNIKNKLTSNILVVAIERDNKVIVPNGDFIFKEDDKIVITATPKNVSKLFKEMHINFLKVKNVMIIGGSKIAYYLAKSLKDENINVKIIENNIDKCNQLLDKLDNVLIINGDGSDKNLLLEEGIENQDAFVAVTSIDEENVVFSMFANSINVPKVITKINHLNFSEILDNIGINSTITPHVVASNHILRYVRAKENSLGGSMETLLKFMDDNLEIIEFKINKDFKYINTKLMNIKFKKNLLVVAINRKNNLIFPTGNDSLEINDNIIIATTNNNIKGLNDILR